MIRLPSLQRAWDEYYSGDPAFVQLAEDATDEQKAEHANKWRVLRETGDLSGLLKPGETATKFVCRPIDGETWRAFNDRLYLPADSDKRIGFLLAPAITFRLALHGVSGLDLPAPLKRETDREYGWEMARPEIVALLDGFDKRIVSEIGGVIYDRMNDIPKR